MRHVVMFSGGAGSWAAAKRVAASHGTENLTLLFTDTLIEDADLYRFLDEAAANVGGEFVRLTEGRTPWQVFADTKFLGNSRMAKCSHVLKQEPAAAWLKENCDPSDTTVYVGIDWTEIERYDREPGTRGPKDKGGIKQRMAADGWRYEAPMCEAPYMMKDDVLAWLKAEGIATPRLYRLGFAHNNCGGGCVRAGLGHWAHVRRALPVVYAEWERNEQAIREQLGDVSILRDRAKDETTKPLTLAAFRERIDAGGSIDMFDIGGCGCFVEDAA